MNAWASQPERVHTVWQQLRNLKNVGEMTLMAHFADAEKPDGIADAMVRVEQGGGRAGLPALPVKLGGDALACLKRMSDWVRPGIILLRCLTVRPVAGYCQQWPLSGHDAAQ
ncbi:alanine racemase, catabolic [Enterobacter cancerogenus]|uniref:Alanine racemase, catabolic n=1 Tax=Enterobacter cancerogenus TaxID=69218 RepID=A0A484W5A0_9ENTR|nr:alanine racemase, catabolic [Enterobacter cancerogenus]